MIITTKDANGEIMHLNVRQVHRSLETALPDVLVRLAADFWTGSQRTMTLAQWNAWSNDVSRNCPRVFANLKPVTQ